MNSAPDLQLLSAYMDDALSEPERLALETRMEQDAAMRERLYVMRRIRRAVKTTAQRYTTPQRLRVRIQASAQPPASAPWRRIVLEGRRLFGAQAIAWRPLGVALSVATLALSVVNIAVWQPARDERLMQAAVTSHLQAATARPLVDLASSDRDTVQPWLAERLGFLAPAAVPSVAEVTLVGARLDGLDGHPVAAVVYRLHDHVVHAFIWPATDDSATVTSASMRGLSVNHWSRGGLRYCVVSDLPQGELLAFAQSLAEADHVR
jgi:anti-sigma factor RsiW